MDIEKIRMRNLVLLESRYDQKQDFADALGWSASYVAQMKSGNRPINEKTANKIVKRLNLESGWLDKSRDSIEPMQDVSTDTDVLIPIYDGLAGKGTPGLQASNKMNYVPVKQSWLDDRGYHQSSLVAVHYSLSNMTPVYVPGDRLIVNTDFQGGYQNNKVYAFKEADGSPMLWRVYTRRNGDILLSSEESSEYPDEVIPASEISSLDVLGPIVRLIRDV